MYDYIFLIVVGHNELDSISRLTSLVDIKVVLIGYCSSLILDCD